LLVNALNAVLKPTREIDEKCNGFAGERFRRNDAEKTRHAGTRAPRDAITASG
jgi:hypothetical protein